MTVRSDSDSETYSASVVLSTISDISLDVHVNGHPANVTRYPIRERAVSESSGAVSGSQVPAKSASA